MTRFEARHHLLNVLGGRSLVEQGHPAVQERLVAHVLGVDEDDAPRHSGGRTWRCPGSIFCSLAT